MPDVDRRSTRLGDSAFPPLVELRELADGLVAIEPLVTGIESRLDGLPVEAQHVEIELRRFFAILDAGRRLFAQRTAEVIAGYEAGDHDRSAEPVAGRRRITVAELAAYGLPESAVGVAWTSFEECAMHAVDHAAGRVGVQPSARGVVLHRGEDVDCSDCPTRG